VAEATKSIVRTDCEKGAWVESVDLSNRDLGIQGPWEVKIRKRTLHGGLSEGVDVVEVSNGSLAFTVVPTRGMGIQKGSYRGSFLGWKSPVRGPVSPSFIQSGERGGLGWIYGFDECIVRCGLAWNGAPGIDVVTNNMGEPSEVKLDLHGKIANTPAHYVEVQAVSGAPPEIRIIGIVDEAALFSPQLRLKTTISTRAGSNVLSITDEIMNLKSVPAEMQLLYHCNFGKPFLEKGARAVVAASRVIPRDARAASGIEVWSQYEGPTPGFVEQAYWFVPAGDGEGNTLALLKNAAGEKGIALRFNLKELPCFTLWKNTGAESDGYVTGLEPATNYPNTRRFERGKGRVVTLEPGVVYTAHITLEVHDEPEGVAAVEREITDLRGGKAVKISPTPDPDFTPLD